MESRKLTKEDIDKVRDIEGFPVGKDEDIIALSNPPYYTACPNPFIEDFIKEHGKPYDEKTDDYHREPFAKDVSGGKGDAIYKMHTYHTKVPPTAILEYILHYTNPGDIVYDAFAGSGMTGVACAMAKDESQNYFGKNFGKRYCILNDLAVAASFISQGYNYPWSLKKAEEVANKALDWLDENFGWAYKTKHIDTSQKAISGESFGTINYTVWSDIITCPHCGSELNYYEIGIDSKTGHKKSGELICPHCNYSGKATSYDRALSTIFDEVSGKSVNVIKEKPVIINYSFNGKEYNKKPDEYDLEIIDKVNKYKIDVWYPTNNIPDGFNTNQSKKSHLIERIDNFYYRRSLISFAKLWDYVLKSDEDIRNILLYWLQSTSIGFTKTNRYFSSSYSQVNRYLKGALYIAATRSEVSPRYALSGKAKNLKKLISNPDCLISCMSSENSMLPDNSVDYIFIDPPFGSNIMYSDLNIIWESWLKVFTQTTNEAIINEFAKKDDAIYHKLMLNVLKDCFRVLKPNRWITIEFHNSQNKVWNILQSVIRNSGFIIADIRMMDKKVETMKQYSTKNSVDKDLIISAYKPSNNLASGLQTNANSNEYVWEYVRQHLEKLPIVVVTNKKLEIIPERTHRRLYNSILMYYLMNGSPLPLSATEFYSGLDEHFLKRDEMYFLVDQVAEYDTARITNEINPLQMELFISDEKGAIAWLFKQLKNKPQLYTEIQPKYFKLIQYLENGNQPLELYTLLEENFLQDENGKWYVPDVTKAGDIAKLREKKLLKEFDEYLSTKGNIKMFRLEAIKAGFTKLWIEKNFEQIVSIADRLPDSIFDDEALLNILRISRLKVE